MEKLSCKCGSKKFITLDKEIFPVTVGGSVELVKKVVYIFMCKSCDFKIQIRSDV